MRAATFILLTTFAIAAGCASDSPHHAGVPEEVCLHPDADSCFGPAYTQLSESQLRGLNGSFVLSCDGIEKLTDDYRKSCIAQLEKAHADLSHRWRGKIEFLPLRESDVQSSAPCVDFANKKTGELIDGWCWEQLQVPLQYSWTQKSGS